MSAREVSGMKALRVLLYALLAVGIVVLLFTVVFPWFDRTFVNDPVMGLVWMR